MSVGRRISNPGRSLAISPYFATQRAFLSSDFSSGDNKLSIPMEKLDFAYSRSSGPGTEPSPESLHFLPLFLHLTVYMKTGGQNVNKLNTKAELRFHVYNADWITADVKARLHVQQANRINNEGELLITAQEHRYPILKLSV
jgi:protein subunit release factor B